MADAAPLALFAWLSPAYPVGAFAYSHGLEWAIESGDVHDLSSLRGWIEDVLRFGAGRNDAILLRNAWCACNGAAIDAAALGDIADLALALCGARERRLEALQQGAGFLDATRAAWPAPQLDAIAATLEGRTIYAVAFGAALAAHGFALRPGLDGFVSTFTSNLVSAAVRMGAVGQTDGQRLVAQFAPLAAHIAEEAQDAGLDALGGCAFRVDLSAMHHETQYSRLFRS